MSNELAKTTDNELVLDASVASLLAGVTVTGFEDAQVTDFAIPFINILQTNSPQVDRKNPKAVEGAYAGAFFNTVSQEVMETVKVIPFGFKKVFVEWVPRELGGGFVAKYLPGKDAATIAAARPGENNKMFLPNGNNLVETSEHYIIVLPEQGEPYLATMPLTGTKLTPSKKWMSLMHSKTAKLSDGSVRRLEMFMQVYELSVVSQTNNKGSFYSLGVPEFVGVTPKQLIPVAIKAAQDIESLSAKVDAAYAESADGQSDSHSDNTVDVAAEMK